MEVMPSTTQWVWRVSELVAAGATRYVEVPDKESAEYSGLADVDPKTLDQSSETVAAWETVTRAAQSALDQIESIDDKVTRAESSAARRRPSPVSSPKPPDRSSRMRPRHPRRRRPPPSRPLPPLPLRIERKRQGRLRRRPCRRLRPRRMRLA